MSVPRIALYEFMPYGAPELLEDSPRNLTRAMSVAMTFLVTIYLALMGVLPWLAHAPLAPPVIEGPHFVVPPPPPALTPAQPTPSVLPIAHPTASIPLPVPDNAAPPDATIFSQDEIAQIGPADGTGPLGEGITVAPPPVESLPGPNDFVYVEELPAVVTPVRPLYPDMAREVGVEGDVLLQALVGTDGHVKDVRVVKSVPLLDAAAVDAMRRWVFTPALNNKKPVAVWVRVPMAFRLR